MCSFPEEVKHVMPSKLGFQTGTDEIEPAIPWFEAAVITLDPLLKKRHLGYSNASWHGVR